MLKVRPDFAEKKMRFIEFTFHVYLIRKFKFIIEPSSPKEQVPRYDLNLHKIQLFLHSCDLTGREENLTIIQSPPLLMLNL